MSKEKVEEVSNQEEDGELYEHNDHFFQTSYFETPNKAKKEIKIIVSKSSKKKEKVKSLFSFQEKKEPKITEFKIIKRKINFLVKVVWE